MNDALKMLQASNGINIYKECMKEKFKSEPREYFLVRPINSEFIEYAAQDVEDLVEIF